MYPTGSEFKVIDIYRNENIQRAVDDHIIRSMMEKDEVRPKFHHIVLVRIGSWMEAFGYRIKSRYETCNDLEVQVAS